MVTELVELDEVLDGIFKLPEPEPIAQQVQSHRRPLSHRLAEKRSKQQ
jgi:hypothetical protein